MAYSIVSDTEIAANIASCSSAVISKLANNNEGTAAGDMWAPKLQIYAMPAPSAGNAVIRECRVSGSFDTSYQLIRTWPVIVTGTFRTQILLRNHTSTGTLYARVYRNGAAYGTERSIGAGSSGSWNQDLSLTAGDSIEIWARHSAGGFNSFMQFRIGVSAPMRPIAKQL